MAQNFFLCLFTPVRNPLSQSLMQRKKSSALQLKLISLHFRNIFSVPGNDEMRDLFWKKSQALGKNSNGPTRYLSKKDLKTLPSLSCQFLLKKVFVSRFFPIGTLLMIFFLLLYIFLGLLNVIHSSDKYVSFKLVNLRRKHFSSQRWHWPLKEKSRQNESTTNKWLDFI